MRAFICLSSTTVWYTHDYVYDVHFLMMSDNQYLWYGYMKEANGYYTSHSAVLSDDQ